MSEQIQHDNQLTKSPLRFDSGWHYETPGYKNGNRKAGWYKLTAYIDTWENIIRTSGYLSFEEAKIEAEQWLLEVAENKFIY